MVAHAVGLADDIDLAQRLGHLQCLAGGLSGCGVYRFQLDGEFFVLRTMRLSDERVAVVRRECRVSQLAGEEDCAPKVYYQDPDRGIMVTEYVAGVAPSPDYFIDTTHVAAMLAHLHCIHACHTDGVAGVRAQTYAARIRRHFMGAAESACLCSTDELLACLSELEARIDAEADPDGFGHFDLHFGNMLVTSDDRLMILDWGDAGVGSILADLAQFSIFCHRDEVDAQAWLNAYFGDATSEALLRNFAAYRAMSYLLQYSAAVENASKLGEAGVTEAESKTVDSHFERARRHFTGEQPINTAADFKEYARYCLEAFRHAFLPAGEHRPGAGR